MSPPDSRNGRPRQKAPAPITAHVRPSTTRTNHSAALTTAAAIVGSAAGRRRHDALIVEHCPWCQHMHLHRGAPGIRRAGCDRGTYLVVAHDHATVSP